MKKGSTNHSFVILAYKDSPYLERCIESLLKQTVKSDLLLSTPTPSLYIKKIAKYYKISVVISPGGGIGCDWNFAYNASKTRYVTLAHQDDIYLPRYAEKCLKHTRRNTLIVFTNYKEIDKNSHALVDNLNLKIKRLNIFPLRVLRNTSCQFLKKLLLSFCNPVACPSVFYDKKNLGNFLFDENLKFTLDWKAWIGLAKTEGSFSYAQDILMYHRIHEESETSLQTFNKNRVIEEKEIFNSLWPKFLAGVLLCLYRYNSRGQLKLVRQ